MDNFVGIMEWYSKWLEFRSKPLLPLTLNKDEYSSSSFSNFLQRSKCNAPNQTEEHEIAIQATGTDFRHRRKTQLMSVAFPAYLNNGASGVKTSGGRRRSSLLESLEQTMELMSAETKSPRLTYPKSRLRHSRSSDGDFAMSYLPVPVYELNTPKALDTTVKQVVPKEKSGSTWTSVIAITLIFLAAIFLLFTVYRNFPELKPEEKEKVKLPRDMEDAKELGRVLSKYKDTYYFEVMSAFFITYIFLQTFAIPGSVFLSILSGFLYPFYIALFLVCLCSGIGATGCYMISYFIGKPLVNKYLKQRVEKWNTVVDGQREHLFNYLLFLRITPFLPNWFINIVSPVIHIPVWLFFSATFIGVAPLSFIAIQAGTTLYQLTTAGDAISWTGVGVMAVLAVLSLLPVLLKNKLKNKFE
uniref:Transmembrane protein 41B n=1 Tax=Phallusia mammillata TaxID=59560 RepID=A0A6F9DVE3_9ASCI|nr:transmembrane protein 41B [Phallusia mammillata]